VAACEEGAGPAAEAAEALHYGTEALEGAGTASKALATYLIEGSAAGALEGVAKVAEPLGEVGGYAFAFAAFKAASDAFNFGGEDPADQGFKAVFAPVFVPVPEVAAPSSDVSGAFESLNRLFAAQVRFDEVAVALRTSLDRETAASAAANQLWSGLQANASAKYALEAAAFLNEFPSLALAVEHAFVKDKLSLALTRHQFATVQAEIANHGLPAGSARLLEEAAGALQPPDNAEVKVLRADLLNAAPIERAVAGAGQSSLHLPAALGLLALFSAEGQGAAALESYGNDILSPQPNEQPQLRLFADGCPEAGAGSTGYTTGDPHLETLSGAHYDFQAAGEFTLVRSDDGGLDVQIRQQPDPSLTAFMVTFDTAVAMQVARTRVEVDPGTQVLVDGRPIQLNGLNIDHLPGGGELYSDPVGDVVVQWPGGSKAVIYYSGTGGYVVFTAAPDLVGKLTGLLTAVAEPEGGRGLPSGDEVLLGGNDRLYAINPTTTSGFRTMYSEFAPTWQITAKESLFTYARGKTTRSYILKNFPRSGYFVSSVPSARVGEIKKICRKAGVTTVLLLDDCVYDGAAIGGHYGAIAAVTAKTETVVNAAANGGPVPLPTSSSGPISTTVPLGAGHSLPVVAADPTTGTTYVAWPTDSANAIDLCVIVATGRCNGTGTPDKLTDPAAGTGGSAQYSDPRIVIMPDSGQVVVVAAVIGVPSSQAAKVLPPGYTGSGGDVAWASPAGGAAFRQPGEGVQNTGKFLDSTVPPEAGAVPLSQTVIAVFENDTYQSAFSDFSLTNPAPAAPADPSPMGGYGQAANSDSGQLAAQPVRSPAGDDIVVGIALGTDSNECPSSLTTVGWGSAVGNLAQASSAGALNDSATWPSSDFKLLTCSAGSPTLAGGPSGIGEIDQEGPGLAKGTQLEIVYRHFDVAKDRFGSPVEISSETKVSSGGADAISLSQDSTGTLYAAWLDSRGVVVSRSSDGGAHWSVPLETGLAVNGIGNDFVVQGLGAQKFAIAYNKPLNPTTNWHYLTTFNYGPLSTKAAQKSS
jgi:hypothetical protein